MVRRSWVWTAVVGVVALALPVVPRQLLAQPELEQGVDRAMTCYAQFDYDCVLEALAGFSVIEAARTHPRALVEMGARVLAVTFIIQEVPERARAIFLELLTVWPDYRLEGPDLAPRFFHVFHQSHADLQAHALAAHLSERASAQMGWLTAVNQGTSAAAAVRARLDDVLLDIALAEQPTPVRTGPDFRLAAGLGFQRLAGDDAEAYDDSFGFSLRLLTDRFFGLALEIALDRYVHDVILPNLVASAPPQLEVVDLSLSVGYPLYFDAVRVAFHAGAGYSTFGFGGPFEQGAALLEASVEASVALPSGLGVGAEVRPRLAITSGDEGAALSTPVSIGIYIIYDLRLD